MEKLSILILDDEPKITEQLTWHLQKKEMRVTGVNKPEEAFRHLCHENTDILLLDVIMPGVSGLEVLEKIKSVSPDTAVIMMSGYGDMEMVINAMRLGAADFIRKPFQMMDILVAIERTGKMVRLQNKLDEVEIRHSLLTRELELVIDKDYIGVSSAIKKVTELALRVASDPDVNVLITGENGTGKEIISRIIHFASPRKKGIFVPVNSAAIPDSLLESEFFGHVKGAFTDARDDKKGFLEIANGGTLFLDEIGDMPVSLQAKLLRVLEEHKIRKVGGSREIVVDVRIISATNKNPADLVKEGKFRIDLYHRINTIEIHIPPLRERTEDIEPILRHFVHKIALKKNRQEPSIDKQVIEKLRNYSFPGNVRELRNLTERAMILSNGNQLLQTDFPLSEHNNPKERCSPSTLNLDEMEQLTVREALLQTDYNQTEAAVMLGISRDALKRKIQKYNLDIRKSID